MSEAPSAGATAVLYDGHAAEMVVAYADPATGGLHTMQFQESRSDTGEAELTAEFNWKRPAPPGAGIVIPGAGQTLARLDAYWLIWRTRNLLFGQPSRSPDPLSSQLEEGEHLIDRPVVTAGQELHAYGWRDGSLRRHRFPARPARQAAAWVESVFDRGKNPARSMCVPLPGDAAGTAVIAAVDEIEGTIGASLLYVRGGNVMQVEGQAEGKYRLMARHRMGVHAGKKGKAALAVMTESLEDGGYSLLEARFDTATQECVWKRTRLEAIAPGKLESAAVFFHKTQDVRDPVLLAVDTSGNLRTAARRTTRILRPDAGTEYGYPVLMTAANRYEAVGTGSGIRLRRL